jgi:hypothetical protein
MQPSILLLTSFHSTSQKTHIHPPSEPIGPPPHTHSSKLALLQPQMTPAQARTFARTFCTLNTVELTLSAVAVTWTWVRYALAGGPQQWLGLQQ